MLGSGIGLPTARIFIVGEAWGEREATVGQPFVGPSGALLDEMLLEAGILRRECFVTNLVNARPPNNDLTAWVPVAKKDIKSNFVPLRDKLVDPIVAAGYANLLRELSLVKPNIIIALGGSALWALTGATGILKWRGSQIWSSLSNGHARSDELAFERTKVVPTIHPAAVLRDMSLRPTVVNDLKRAAAERASKDYTDVPEWNFVIHPTFSQASEVFDRLFSRLEVEPLWIDFDLETKAGHIDCAGISWSLTEAMCLPFMSAKNREGYWTAEEEAFIVYSLYRLLTHKNVLVRGQNLLYDAQYCYRHWHWVPRVAQDTMISWHSCFAGQKKSLDYQASLLCNFYTQWKPDKQAWKEGG